MTQTNFTLLSQKTLALPCAHPVRLIAIDGAAGSGKSTFAGYLAQVLAAPIIPMDDFIAWDDLTEFWPRFEEQVLGPLFQGRAIRYQKRDWAGDNNGRGLRDWRELPPSPVIILEGIGAARRAVASRLCYAIWIQAPAQLRLQRGLERDIAVPGAQELWESFMPGEKDFFEADGALQRADMVVDGSVPYEGEQHWFRTID